MADTPLDEALKDPKKQETMKSLLKDPNTKRLMELLNKSAGGDLKSMATAAMRGDSSGLVSLMNQVMNDPEGAKAVRNVTDAIPK